MKQNINQRVFDFDFLLIIVAFTCIQYILSFLISITMSMNMSTSIIASGVILFVGMVMRFSLKGYYKKFYPLGVITYIYLQLLAFTFTTMILLLLEV